MGGVRFGRELWRSIQDDNVTNGAAALAYNLMLAIFPFAIFLLSLLPYLPVPNLQQAIMDALRQALPGQAAQLFEGTVESGVSQRRGGLLSLGIVLTLWAMSGGMSAVMTGLNSTYDVREGRPFWKSRGIALMLSVMLALLLVVAFALIVGGGYLQQAISDATGGGAGLALAFQLVRWVVIAAALLLAFALVYYFGPDVEQRFRFISPGSVVGAGLLVAASWGFRVYVNHFASYDKTYGSLGTVIVLMLWLYITGLVLLVGSEINAIVEHHAPNGRQKGEKRQPRSAPSWRPEPRPAQ